MLAAQGDPQLVRQSRVHQLIDAYRGLGHLVADIDPLGLREVPELPELDPAHYGLDGGDLATVFDELPTGLEGRTLDGVVAGLRAIYCGSFAVEYLHIADRVEKEWIRERLEADGFDTRPEPAIRRHLLARITAAEALERYLHNRYVGQKRFSLEGAETLIPLLDELIQRGGAQGVKEIAIGMAHRGRLNVLVNIMGKAPADLFLEFEGRNARAKARATSNTTWVSHRT